MEITYTPSPVLKLYILLINTARYLHQKCLHPKDHCLHREMPVKEMGEESEAKREAGMIKIMTRSTGTSNATSVVEKDI